MLRTLFEDAGYSNWMLTPSSAEPIGLFVSQAGRTRSSHIANQEQKVSEDITTENCSMICLIYIVLFVAENV